MTKFGSLRRTVCLLALSLVGCGIFGSVSAQAASLGNAGVTALCNSKYHTMDVSSRFNFNTNRYPHGAYLSVRYAYVRVDGSGRPITNNGRYYTNDWNYTNWISKGHVRPDWRYQGDYFSSHWVLTPSYLGGVRLPPTWGHWIASVRVAASLNRADWEYSDWARADEYQYQDWYGPAGSTSHCCE